MNRQQTGIRDEKYDLISVLYHIAQGAETNETYVHDAEEAGDQELASYFREVQQQYRSMAQRGEELLAKRFQRS